MISIQEVIGEETLKTDFRYHLNIPIYLRAELLLLLSWNLFML